MRITCLNLLAPAQAAALEEHVFQHGPSGLRLYWCSHIGRVCESRQVVDSGDL